MTSPPEGATDASPSISPSGKIVAFVRTWGSNSSDLFTVPVAGGKPVRVTSDSRDIQGVAWLDEHQLIYSSDRGGPFRLWQIARTGGYPEPVPANGARPKWPAVSRDGHWLAFVDSENDASI